QRRGISQQPHDRVLHQEPQRGARAGRGKDRKPGVHTMDLQFGEDICAYHRERAMSEIDSPGAAIDQDDPRAKQRVESTDAQAKHSKLDRRRHLDARSMRLADPRACRAMSLRQWDLDERAMSVALRTVSTMTICDALR